MAFTISSKPVVRRFEFSDGLALEFRGFTKEERGVYDKKLALIAGKKNFADKFIKIMEAVAIKLLVGWSGVQGDDGQELELNEENGKAFLAHHEAQKYWLPALSEILNPVRKAEAADDDADEIEVTDDFLSGL
jgi:hypothetical protein